MADEDEVERRARVIAEAHAAILAKERALADRRAAREDTMESAVTDLLHRIFDNASRRTSYSFAVTEDSIVCFSGADEETEHVLFRAELAVDDDDIDEDDWTLLLNCEASYSSDPETDFEGEERWLEFERAVEFGVDAVLDGLAVLTAKGEHIASAEVNIRSLPDTDPETPYPVEDMTPEGHASPARTTPPLSNGQRPALGLTVAVLIVAALAVWVIAKFSGG